MTKEELYQLLQKYQDGTASIDEIKIVQSWMLLKEEESDPALSAEHLVQAKQNIWEKLSPATTDTVIDPQPVKIHVMRALLRYAAVFLLLISAGSAGYNFRYQLLDIINPVATVTVATNAYETRKVWLPDSSLVVLAENTKLNYPSKFRGIKRHVTMQGKAFFDVRKNPDQPFTISSGEVNVKVLGTSFEVKNITGNDTAFVTVVTGKVAISKGDEVKSLAMPNEQMVLLKQSGKYTLTQLTDAAAYAGWINNKLNFNETSLSLVFEQLAAVYDVPVRFDQQLLSASGTFSGVFKNAESLEDVLDIICLSTGYQWKRSQNGINITR